VIAGASHTFFHEVGAVHYLMHLTQLLPSTVGFPNLLASQMFAKMFGEDSRVTIAENHISDYQEQLAQSIFW
jgi:hypothetical protein